jgi:RNA polymerase sigma-70 factor, ECF subfamily
LSGASLPTLTSSGINTTREPVASGYTVARGEKLRCGPKSPLELGGVTLGVTFQPAAANSLVAEGADLDVLMARYQAGDITAANALIDCVSPQLHRFFRAQLATRADADDLLQETWMRIHRVRQTYRAGEPVLAWFYAIARHVGLDHYRKVRRAAARERKWVEMARLAAEPAVERDRADELEALLQPLTRNQREVIEMLKVAGMSLEEVARATSSSVGAVKQKVHRAYKTLRKRVNALGRGEKPSGALS